MKQLTEIERSEVAKAGADGCYPTRSQLARRERLHKRGVLGWLWPGRWYVTKNGQEAMGQRFAEIASFGWQNQK